MRFGQGLSQHKASYKQTQLFWKSFRIQESVFSWSPKSLVWGNCLDSTSAWQSIVVAWSLEKTASLARICKPMWNVYKSLAPRTLRFHDSKKPSKRSNIKYCLISRNSFYRRPSMPIHSRLRHKLIFLIFLGYIFMGFRIFQCLPVTLGLKRKFSRWLSLSCRIRTRMLFYPKYVTVS